MAFPFCVITQCKRRSLNDQARCANEKLHACGLDQHYLKMMQEGLPKGAGMALGVDRLCMIFTDSADIRDVLCFSWDEL